MKSTPSVILAHVATDYGYAVDDLLGPGRARSGAMALGAESGSYIALKPCGCLAIAIVDNPEHRRDVARELAKGIRQGYQFRLIPTQAVREMPWHCPGHQKKKAP